MGADRSQSVMTMAIDTGQSDNTHCRLGHAIAFLAWHAYHLDSDVQLLLGHVMLAPAPPV